MPIYTKKGDKGETGLFTGIRVAKDSLITDTLGNLDEANSWLGIVGGMEDTQKDLMTILSILAGAKVDFPPEKTLKLEKEIDKLEATLPLLTQFIVPGGKKRSAHLHYARTLIRRAERSLVRLSNVQKISPDILTFINRLSDYLFVLARKANI